MVFTIHHRRPYVMSPARHCAIAIIVIVTIDIVNAVTINIVNAIIAIVVGIIAIIVMVLGNWWSNMYVGNHSL